MRSRRGCSRPRQNGYFGFSPSTSGLVTTMVSMEAMGIRDGDSSAGERHRVEERVESSAQVHVPPFPALPLTPVDRKPNTNPATDSPKRGYSPASVMDTAFLGCERPKAERREDEAPQALPCASRPPPRQEQNRSRKIILEFDWTDFDIGSTVLTQTGTVRQRPQRPRALQGESIVREEQQFEPMLPSESSSCDWQANHSLAYTTVSEATYDNDDMSSLGVSSRRRVSSRSQRS